MLRSEGCYLRCISLTLWPRGPVLGNDELELREDEEEDPFDHGLVEVVEEVQEEGLSTRLERGVHGSKVRITYTVFDV